MEFVTSQCGGFGGAAAVAEDHLVALYRVSSAVRISLTTEVFLPDAFGIEPD